MAAVTPMASSGTDNDNYVYTRAQLKQKVAEQQIAIQSAQIDQKKAQIEYDAAAEKQEKGQELAKIDGVVTKVAASVESLEKNEPYLVVQGSGGVMVQGTVSEMNLDKLTDAVKMRGLIAPASKETRIPKSIYEGIQTINRNLVCMLELQINAYWATRPSHFVLLNAQKLRDTQHMMQQILLSLVHALYECNPQPVFANTEKLNDAVEELRQLLNNHHDLKVVETPIYGYVWLNMETAHQLELLSNLICRALRK